MYADYETLLIERADKVLTISFNRPELRNATNQRMHQELERVFLEVNTDPDTNVVVITGVGKTFSAGGDINTMITSVDDQARWLEAMREAKAILDNLVAVDRPVIAKVNGHAIGLGSTLALFCDIIIAADDAKIADPHIKVGLTTGDGGAIIWPLLIGYARAKKYLLTGAPITGKDAAEIGLITESCPADELDARVDAVARELAEGATVAMRLTKKSINMSLKHQLDLYMEAHLGYETMSHLSNDHREALYAFRDKRPPRYTGT